MNREIYINLDNLIDLLECIQDASSCKCISDTIDEVIDIAYFLASE